MITTAKIQKFRERINRLYQIAPVRAALSIAPMSVVDWAVSIGAGLLAMVLIRAGKHLKFFQNKA